MTVAQALTWTLVALLALGWAAWMWLTTPPQRAAMRHAEKRERARKRAEAAAQPNRLICPHCQTRGRVSVQAVIRKRGVSGGKATGALLTGGASMLLVGLSRKESAQRMTCGHCGTTWDVA